MERNNKREQKIIERETNLSSPKPEHLSRRGRGQGGDRDGARPVWAGLGWAGRSEDVRGFAPRSRPSVSIPEPPE